MNRAMPYVLCDTDGAPITAEQDKQIITDHWTVCEQVRRRRRSKKGKALSKSCKAMSPALKAQRGDPPSPAVLAATHPVKQALPPLTPKPP